MSTVLQEPAEAGRTANPAAGAADAAASAAFAAILFRRVPQEDLRPLPPDVRAELARAAYLFLAEPRGDRPRIRLVDTEVQRGGRRAVLTVLEAVNSDQPFLLDSTLAALVAQGIEPLLVAHPVLAATRDAEGSLLRLEEAQGAPTSASSGAPSDDARRESLIHMHLPRIADESARAALLEELRRTYADVAAAVADWGRMRIAVGGVALRWRSVPPPLPREVVAEAAAFLDWIGADNFIFLGLREYRLPQADLASGATADPVEGSGLGVLRDPAVRVLRRGTELVAVTPEIRAFLARPEALIITKANIRSRVHRRAHLDMVAIKLFGDDGALQGELRLVGLFAASAYEGRTDEVPVLRRKAAGIVARAGFDPASYSGRALTNVLESFPRDELFQAGDDALYDAAMAILRLQERPRIRVISRLDEYDRFVSVLVFVPKDRYDSRVRRKVGEFLARMYRGRVSAAYPAYPEGPLARTHFIIGRDEGATPKVDQAVLEAGVAALVRTWDDALRTALAEAHPSDDALRLGSRYAGAFGAAYQERFGGEQALADIAVLEGLSEATPRAVSLYRREDDPNTRVNLKLVSRGAALPLSERVPLLENLGFRVVNERTCRIGVGGADGDVAEAAWLHDMSLERAAGGPLSLEAVRGRVEDALLALLDGRTESDGFNRLVLEAGFAWRDAALMRLLGRYLQQLRIPYAQEYVAATLARHGAIAAQVMALFQARFDPGAADREGTDGSRAPAQQARRAMIEDELAKVSSLDDDRILRRYVNLVEAAIRTSFYQVEEDGAPRRTVAVKWECARVEGMPRPRPLYEIFVHSPRVEGVHLRFGKVARGGLRWSARPQDFRTEVLGLVKAQQVKNAVIVPVGAKGGFFPKRLPPASDRAAWMAEGTGAYQDFVRALLQLTDNLVDDRLVPPPLTVRHDGDDPYLVVAADKGTATFSDVANALSLEAGHWLGDAFASGGSHGYDHKGMGITARGAWEAVRRHFREMDVDADTAPITVAGVGDMSGDVFGNGMLLSRAMKLVAAFDHRDIFLDPDPDPAASWEERDRLFKLPRSSWQDYDRARISAGGGVHSRQAKSIPLTPQVQAVLGLQQQAATPAEVMSAILRAQVDLLWFGGIGTYVRASTETDDQAGDRANDAVRIAAPELRAKVVGEGANLGLTQRGRIEAGRAGVRLNTDAIDNSAGVNTSDVEVNIKIALSTPERDRRLSFEARNALLAEMTDEVARLVLRNNFLQVLALSLAERPGAAALGDAARLMGALEAEGRLDRGVEFLPPDADLSERARRGEGLTRPELAVLLAYAKLSLHDALLGSPVPDDPYLGRELERYFPAQVREHYPDAIASHRLRREIIATQLSNAIVNRAGPAVATLLRDRTGADPATIAAAYAAARDAYGLIELNAAIDALGMEVPGKVQLGLYASLQDVLLGRMTWFIRNASPLAGNLDAVVGRYRAGIAEVEAALPTALGADAVAALGARAEALRDQRVPESLARRLAAMQDLVAAPDIVLVAGKTGRPVADTAAIHFAMGGLFATGPLEAAAREMPAADHYDRLALDRAADGIAAAHRALTAEAAGGDGAAADAVAAWQARRGAEAARIRDAVGAIAGTGLTPSKLAVAAGLLGDLARG